MAELTFYQWANALKGYMLAIGVAFAIYIVARWWHLSQKNQRAQREAQAKRVYADYLLQAMQNPELARPGPTDTVTGRMRAQYQWFVGYLLTVAEEIMLIDPAPAWRETLARQLAPHRAFLTSQAFLDGPYRTLSMPVRQAIADAVGDAGRVSAGPGHSPHEARRA